MSELQQYQNEQEYEKELLSCVRRMLGVYGKEHLRVSESGILRRAGGMVTDKEELETLMDSRRCAAPARKRLEEEKKTLFAIRRKGRDTTRGGVIIAMEYLFHAFGLDWFEAYMVILSWAAEADHDLGILFSLLNERNGVRLPTIDLCIRAWTDEEEERLFLFQQCMKRWQSLSFLFGGMYEQCRRGGARGHEGFLELELKLDHRIVSFLQDYASQAPDLQSLLQYGYPGQGEMLIHKGVAEGLLKAKRGKSGPRVAYISGEHGAGKRFLAAELCRRTGKFLLLVEARKIPKDAEQAQRLFHEIAREALLRGGAAVCFGQVPADEAQEELVSREYMELLLQGMRFFHGELFFTSTREWNGRIRTFGQQVCKIRIPETTTEERELLWNAFLQEEEKPEGLNLEYLADKYALSAGAIQNSVEDYRSRIQLEGGKPQKRWLLEACRRQLDHRLGRDAVRIPVKYRWDDLVLPNPQKKMLKDACDQVRCRHQVYRRWGFEEKFAYGKGVSMIFYGPPGTGKTMGAQVIANELDLELYKVDMAGVMSKYVGESEKKLGNIFEQAGKSQSILFFDEADVLFGKRTDQKDSNDKYANASTAYLLQKIEEYEGILILATNLLQNFDNAFLRRFKFIIEFPTTDEERRLLIWQKAFPPAVPVEELDLGFLAQEYSFSGSQIKNAAVAAAFLAAGEAKAVGMRHILTAVKRETAKTGKTMIAGDFGPYYDLMQKEE